MSSEINGTRKIMELEKHRTFYENSLWFDLLNRYNRRNVVR